MIKHTVLFRLKRRNDEQARKQFIAELEKFAAVVPHTVAIELHESIFLRGEGPRTADVMLQVTMNSADDFMPYLTSDAHEALLHDVLEPECEGWWSVQFEA